MKTMKFFLAVAVLATASCNKAFNEPQIDIPADLRSFVATTDGTDTKTVIDGTTSYWQGTERIYVMDGANKKAYSSTVAEKQRTTTFNEEDANLQLASGADYIAVYPASAADNAGWNGEAADAVTGLSLSAAQKMTTDSFDPDAHLAIAYTTDNTLDFKNIVALVKFTVGYEGVDKVVFKATGGEQLCGTFDVLYNGGKPVFQNLTSASSEVALEGKFVNGGTYYIAILPQTLENGFTLNYYADNQLVYTISKEVSVTFEASKGIDFKNPDMYVSLDKGGTAPANTYVVKETGRYSFAAVKPDGTALEGANNATWLYKTSNGIIKNVAYQGGNIQFEVDEVGGYGEIIVRDNMDNVLWTYLVWSTAELEDVTIGDITVMDRTIGAWEKPIAIGRYEEGCPNVTEAAVGCYYQWGHNSAYPGPNTSSISRTAHTEKVAFSDFTLACIYNWDITRPTNGGTLTAYADDVFFIHDEIEENDITMDHKTANPWCFSHKNLSTKSNGGQYSREFINALWGDSVKGLYDPCPAGYKVISFEQAKAMKTTLAKWTNAEFPNSWGRTYTNENQTINFVGTGIIEWGQHINPGRTGYEWTSTTATGYSSYYIENWHEYVEEADNKIQNFNRAKPVRCVKM